MNPIVTVLMTVFNGERHLASAIRSVLAQTFRDFELLVIDDGSQDRSADLVGSFDDPRVRLVRQARNFGLVASLNHGLELARGEWIARQDADDLSEPTRLAEQLKFVRAHPAVPLVGADAKLIGDRGNYRGRWRTGGHADLVRWDMNFRTPFAHSSAIFRRSVVVDRLGGYRDRRASEDLDLWSRVARDFPVVTLRRELVSYRLHGRSIMAAENAGIAGSQVVAEILQANLADTAPGLTMPDREEIATVWTSDAPTDWRTYFAAREELVAVFLRGRSRPPGWNQLAREHHFTLLCRRADRAARMRLLRALWHSSRAEFVRLPWVRVAAALVR